MTDEATRKNADELGQLSKKLDDVSDFLSKVDKVATKAREKAKKLRSSDGDEFGAKIASPIDGLDGRVEMFGDYAGK